MKLLLLSITFFMVGCSTLTSTTNYEIENNKELARTHVHDLCEENQISLGIFGTQCGGIYNPPAFSYEIDDSIYVFYPMQININLVSIGPLIAPLIPLFPFADDEPVKESISYKIRVLSKNKLIDASPQHLSIISNDKEVASCELQAQTPDFISDIFTCELNVEHTMLDDFESVLRLANGSNIKIGYSKKTFWSYRPVIAPAGKGGNWDTFIRIEY